MEYGHDDSYEANTYPDGVIITTDFKQMPAVPKVTGILFSIYMGFIIVFGLIYRWYFPRLLRI